MKLALLVACLCFAPSGAAADEIRLANGDRISGQIKGRAGDRLIVATPYAGEVALDWRQVVSISTTQPVEVMLRGAAAPTLGTLQPLYGGGALLVAPDASAAEIALEDIAYLNPEPHRSGLGTSYEGRATLSATYTSGNVESERLYADAELTARARLYRYSLSGKIEQREDPVLGDTSAWLVGGNYDRFLDERRFGYGRTSIEHDEAKDVDRRTALGAGYGVELLDAPAASLSVRGGLDYVVVERFVGPGEEYPAAGWGIKGSLRPKGRKVELFHEQEGFWNLEDTAAVVVRSKTGVRVPLIARINAAAQLNVDWERRPAPGRASTDRTLLLGVDYTW